MSSEVSLQKAPEAACMMVLTEGNVEKSQMGKMVDALNRASQQVGDANITSEADADIKTAWEAMKRNDNAQFLLVLEQAAKKFVAALIRWEKTRNG